MKRMVIGTAAAVLTLTGCSSQAPEDSLDGPTWQVVAVHTTPEMPGDLPADAAGKVSLRFSANSLTATTGCAPLRAQIDRDDDRLTLSQVQLGEMGDCTGGSRYVHDEMTGLLKDGAQFDVDELNDREAMLTAVSDAINRPSIRVMAL